jgi:hypothetical protein
MQIMADKTNYERADYGGVGRENLSTLTVKLPWELRQYWGIKAKKLNTSLSFLIVEAMKAQLGKPTKDEVEAMRKQLGKPTKDEVEAMRKQLGKPKDEDN